MLSAFNENVCINEEWIPFHCGVCLRVICHHENHFLKIPPSKMDFRIEDSETSKLTKQALVKNNDGNARSMSHTQRACEVQLSARLLGMLLFHYFFSSSFVLRLFIRSHLSLYFFSSYISFSWASQFESIGMRFKSVNVNVCVSASVWAINAKYDLLGVRHKH